MVSFKVLPKKKKKKKKSRVLIVTQIFYFSRTYVTSFLKGIYSYQNHESNLKNRTVQKQKQQQTIKPKILSPLLKAR